MLGIFCPVGFDGPMPIMRCSEPVLVFGSNGLDHGKRAFHRFILLKFVVHVKFGAGHGIESLRVIHIESGDPLKRQEFVHCVLIRHMHFFLGM